MRRSLAVWAPLPLRIMLGIAFIYHGAPKVFSAAYHERFAGMLHELAIPLPHLTAWVVGLVELLGGIALIIGVLVGLASVLLIIDMVVALFKVHLAAGFSFVHIIGMTATGPQYGLPGYEVNLLYIAALLTLLIGGAGKLSIDEHLATSRPSPPRG